MNSFLSCIGLGSTPKPTPTLPAIQSVEKKEQALQTSISSQSKALENVSSEAPKAAQDTTNKVTDIFGQTIEKVTAFVISAKKSILSFIPIISVEWTNTKIKQAILAATSGYFLLGAKTIFGGIIPQTFASFVGATPFLAASGALLWLANSLVDYDSKASIAEIHEHTCKFGLGEFLKKHDLEKLFTHKIVNPEEFQKLYRSYTATLTINEIIPFYNKARIALMKANTPLTPSPYEIPHPSESKPLFIEETKGLPLYKFSEKYDLAKLDKFGLLEEGQFANILKMEKLHEQKSEEEVSLKKEVRKLSDSITETTDSIKKLLDRSQKRALTSQEKEELNKLAEGNPSLKSQLSELFQRAEKMQTETKKKIEITQANYEQKISK